MTIPEVPGNEAIENAVELGGVLPLSMAETLWGSTFDHH
jgi:hypothetical protein